MVPLFRRTSWTLRWMTWILNRNVGSPVDRVRQSRRIGFRFVLLGKASLLRTGRKNMRGNLWI